MKSLFFLAILLVVNSTHVFAGLIEDAKCPQKSNEIKNVWSPGKTIYHDYYIKVAGGCPFIVTKIKKIWYSKNASLGKKSAIVKVNVRKGQDSTDPIGEVVYDTNYPISGNSVDDGWTLFFETDPSVKDDEIHSCFFYYGYYDSPNCSQADFDKHFKEGNATSSVVSKIGEESTTQK